MPIINQSRAPLGWVAMVWFLGSGCYGDQSLSSPCREEGFQADPSFCPPCEAKDDCAIVGSLCDSSAVCVPVNATWGETDQWCQFEYARPPDEDCGCVKGVCTAYP